jgi:HEAT repeat protein
VALLQSDPSPLVRAEAAHALGRFVLASELDEIDSHLGILAEEALMAALLNEGESLSVQCRVLESIAFSGETGIRDLIEDAYYSAYEEMQISAVVAMGRSADTRWRATVQTELQSDSPEVRAAAAKACGELENQDALDEMIELLDDPEQMVRLAVVAALGQIGGKQASKALENLLLLDEEFPEYAAAQDALEELSFLSGLDLPLLDDAGSHWGEDESEDDFEVGWADNEESWNDDLDDDLDDDRPDEWNDLKQNRDLSSSWDSDWDDES